jgi:hypothetical protein
MPDSCEDIPGFLKEKVDLSTRSTNTERSRPGRLRFFPLEGFATTSEYWSIPA